MKFAIKISDRLYGPFDRVTQAEKYARASFAAPTAWVIVPIWEPL